jgi:hypothetical protein
MPSVGAISTVVVVDIQGNESETVLLVPVGGIYEEAALEPIPIDRDHRSSAMGC